MTGLIQTTPAGKTPPRELATNPMLLGIDGETRTIGPHCPIAGVADDHHGRLHRSARRSR